MTVTQAKIVLCNSTNHSHETNLIPEKRTKRLSVLPHTRKTWDLYLPMYMQSQKVSWTQHSSLAFLDLKLHTDEEFTHNWMKSSLIIEVPSYKRQQVSHQEQLTEELEPHWSAVVAAEELRELTPSCSSGTQTASTAALTRLRKKWEVQLEEQLQAPRLAVATTTMKRA